MASYRVWLGGFFVVALAMLGTFQTLTTDAPTGTGMAVADTGELTQQDLNLCMNDCMRGCVSAPGDEEKCTAQCESVCGIK